MVLIQEYLQPIYNHRELFVVNYSEFIKFVR